VRESDSADVRASVLWRRLRPRSQAALAEQQQHAHRTAFETPSLWLASADNDAGRGGTLAASDGLSGWPLTTGSMGHSSRVHWYITYGDRVLNPLDDTGFPADITLKRFVERLYAWTGVPPAQMRVVLRSKNGQELVLDSETISCAEAETLTLASVDSRLPEPVHSAEVIATGLVNPPASTAACCKDTHDGSDDEVSYEISESTYATRLDTYRAKKQQLWAAGRSQLAVSLRPGLRCSLRNSNRKGHIAYVGPVPALTIAGDDTWIGVILDEPNGKNDGTAPDGTRYFECTANHGLFVRPERVQVCTDDAEHPIDSAATTKTDTDGIPLEI